MGTVYVAHDKELDREVAVKLLASTLVHDAEVVERFEREARMTAKLDHPHIVPVYDVGRFGGRPFIVMKKLEGQTLAALLRKKGGMTQEETLALFRQLASGLDFIHGQGFIHRDIKAGNIFVGSAGQATLLDFGILRATRGGEALTRTGMVMGTPHYMAPEQAMGQRNVDHRVDLYALAVVLFECLTGTLPFDADSELRLIQMQAHTPPPELIERAPWIAAPVAEVVKRALAKRPEDRFGSASELVAALDAAYRLAQGPTPLPNPSAPSAYLGPTASPATAPSWRNHSQPPVAHPSAPPAATAVPALSPPVAPPLPSAPAPQVASPASTRSTGWLVLLSVLGLAGGLLAVVRPWENAAAATADAGVERFDAGAAAPFDGGESAVLVGLEADAGAGLLDAGGAALDAGGAALDAGLAVVDAGTVFSKKQVGKLNVITTHKGELYWAQVSIDGNDKGRTPLLLELPAGKYTVKVERPGFRSETREIRVASGRPTMLRIELTP